MYVDAFLYLSFFHARLAREDRTHPPVGSSHYTTNNLDNAVIWLEATNDQLVRLGMGLPHASLHRLASPLQKWENLFLILQRTPLNFLHHANDLVGEQSWIRSGKYSVNHSLCVVLCLRSG